MVSARQLYELQEIETDSQRRQQSLEETRRRLEDTSALVDSRGRLEAAQKEHSALRAELRDEELAAQQVGARAKDVERRLYGGRGTTPKELVDLQEDLKQLQRQKEQVETRALELMERVEAGERAVGRLAAEVEEAERRWQHERTELQAEQARLEEELGMLKEREETTREVLSASALALYDSLKKVRGGVAISRVERGICRGCGLSVPSGDLQRARLGQELVRCSSCGRVLYAA